MALIKCPECGKEVSDKAKSCIHCGYPLDECKDEKLQEGDDISEDSPYACKINGILWNLQWVLEALKEYSEEELGMIKRAAKYMMNPSQDVRLSYKSKNQREKKLFYARGNLASDIRNRVDLVEEKANQLIYEILDNNKVIPKEFNGKSHSEWSEEQEKEIAIRLKNAVYCKYCNSTAVTKLRPNAWNFGKQWHCNNCGSDF